MAGGTCANLLFSLLNLPVYNTSMFGLNSTIEPNAHYVKKTKQFSLFVFGGGGFSFYPEFVTILHSKPRITCTKSTSHVSLLRLCTMCVLFQYFLDQLYFCLKKWNLVILTNHYSSFLKYAPPPPPTPLILGATPTAIIFLPLYSMCSTLSERLERHVGPGYTVLLIPQIYP